MAAQQNRAKLYKNPAFCGISFKELSPWCRHIQLMVPRRAQHCATLRNAVFAVSARHLCRLPRYKTSKGIVYQGQLLANLEKSSALGYMLKCMPDLIEFPNIHDPVQQENLMADTVTLRQYEEMEEDMEESEIKSAQRGTVNFLAITHTIIGSMGASPLDGSLATATYWITVRQEIYFALTREAVPHLRFDADRWLNVSIANTMIMFSGLVATWRWGNKSTEEWTRLETQERQLLHDYSGELKPTVDLKAEQMILTAENPHIEKQWSESGYTSKGRGTSSISGFENLWNSSVSFANSSCPGQCSNSHHTIWRILHKSRGKRGVAGDHNYYKKYTSMADEKTV